MSFGVLSSTTIIHSSELSIKASISLWTRSYLDSEDRDWKHTFETLCEVKNLNLFLRSNFEANELPATLPKYYLNSIVNWYEITQYKDKDKQPPISNYIWYNKKIKINGNTIYCDSLFSSGMWSINDLFDSDNRVIPFNVWLLRGAKEMDRLIFLGIIDIIKRSVPNLINIYTNNKLVINQRNISLEQVSQKKC